jgi:pimeloyl-ACP methyl ester carboxylesterase
MRWGLNQAARTARQLFDSMNAAALRNRLFSEPDSFAGDLLFPDTEDPGRIGLVARAVAPGKWSSDLNGDRLLRHLQRIANPTLIVWGANDGLYDTGCAQKFNEAIKGSSLAVIEKCGHLPMFEQEGRFVALVTRFLNNSE